MDAFEIKGKPTHEKKLIQLETLLNIEIPVSGSLILMWWLVPGGILFMIFLSAIILLPVFIIAPGSPAISTAQIRMVVCFDTFCCFAALCYSLLQ